MSVRLSLLALLVALSASASAAPIQEAGSDLDRLTETGGIIAEVERSVAPEPVVDAEKTCPGYPTTTQFPDEFPCPPPPADPVPVDGGLVLLAAAGAGYAAKRLRARRP